MVRRLPLFVSRFADIGSRLFVLLSTGAALYFEAWLGTRGWGELLPYTIIAAVIAFGLRKWRPAVAWFVLLLALYLMPLIFRITINRDQTEYFSIWMGGLFGAVLAGGIVRGWRFPRKWRWALVYWAVAVAIVWPLIVWRETDYWWPLMYVDHIGNSGHGGPPAVIAVWIASVALTHLLGLLFFEAVAGDPEFDGESRFTRTVILPLAFGAALGCALAVYQGTVDVTFLSGHHWASENRAAGSLLDGDGFGALAALWALAFFALAVRVERRAFRAAALGAAVLAWGGAWATGSRMALLGSGAGAVWIAAAGVRALRQRAGARLRTGGVVAAVAIVALGTAGLFFASSSASPLARLRASLPRMNAAAILHFADKEVWSRGGPYGDMSVEMVRRFPIAGVGVGSFNHLFPDFAYERSLNSNVNEGRYPFDNAQSWFRHHLAELGVIGSVGWICWTFLFGSVLLRTRGDDGRELSAWMVKGALVMVAAISLVSMPTQMAPVSMTVWVFAAWYLSLSSRAAQLAGQRELARPGLRGILVAGALLAVFGWATNKTGHENLRPPMRAVMAHWPYRYGFQPLENSTGPGKPFMWMSSTRAVNVEPTVAGHWMRVTVSGGPPDVMTRPMHVQIFRVGKLVVDLPNFKGETFTRYIRIRPGEWASMIQITTDRTWSPADFGERDPRRLGLRVETELMTAEELPYEAPEPRPLVSLRIF